MNTYRAVVMVPVEVIFEADNLKTAKARADTKAARLGPPFPIYSNDTWEGGARKRVYPKILCMEQID